MINAKGKQHRRGFTLLEILVVLGVTTLLTGMVLTYGSRGRNQTTLYVEQIKLAQVILRAKALSVATYNRPDIPCGYGVNIDYNQNSYELFSYKPTDCFSIKAAGIVDDPLNKYVVIDRFALPTGVKLVKNASNDPTATTLATVFFLPPNPETFIWLDGGVFSNNPAIVGVGAVDGSLTMPIQVTAGGQVGY